MKKIRIITTGIVVTDLEVPDDHPGDPWELADSHVRQMQDDIGWEPMTGANGVTITPQRVNASLTIDGQMIYR